MEGRDKRRERKVEAGMQVRQTYRSDRRSSPTRQPMEAKPAQVSRAADGLRGDIEQPKRCQAGHPHRSHRQPLLLRESPSMIHYYY